MAELTIPDAVAATASTRPDRPALIGVDWVMTYKALDEASARLASRLIGFGIGLDDVVGLAIPRSRDAIVAMLGILRAGAAFLPIDAEAPPARVDRLLDEVGSRIVVTNDRRSATARSKFPGRNLVEVVAGAGDGDTCEGPRDADALAYVMYTSGSTGAPKGVGVTHRAILDLVAIDPFVSFRDRSVLHAAPLAFDASTFEIWGALVHGGQVVVLEGPLPTPTAIREAIGLGVDIAFLTTSLFNVVAEEAPDALRGLQRLVIGGEAASAQHLRVVQQHVPGLEIWNGYGPTECTTFSVVHPVQSPLAWEVVDIPIGRPLPRTGSAVVGNDGRELPPGQVGELFLSGPGLARGYVRRADLTADRFVPFNRGEPGARWYRTGDLVRAEADGTLRYVGRVDDQVKVRGHRVEPGEVRAALCSHPAVTNAIVTTRRSSSGSREPIAFCTVAASSRALDGSTLTAYLRGRLPRYMVPSAVHVVPELPLGPTGKVDIESLLEDANPCGAPHDGVGTKLESTLASLCAHLLDVASVPLDADFFDLGGDSLTIIKLLHRVNESFAITVPAMDFLERPTVLDLAGLIENQLSRAARSAGDAGPGQGAASGNEDGRKAKPDFATSVQAGATAILSKVVAAPDERESLDVLGIALDPDLLSRLEEEARARTRPLNGTLDIRSLGKPVEIATDKWGVTHVYADDRDDLYRAQGFLHGSERWWQIDVARRTAEGRLAELLGPTALASDRFFRRMGLAQVLRGVGTDEPAAVEGVMARYSEGLAVGASLRPSLEHALLGTDSNVPETPVEAFRCAWAVSMLLSFSLTSSWVQRTLRSLLAQANTAGALLAGHAPAGHVAPWVLDALVTLLDGLPAVVEVETGAGSNCWAVGAPRTDGGAVLCNDPHLAAQIPPVWMEMSLHYPGRNVAGATLPGIPGIVIGHNDDIAWGMTNSQADAGDLCEERLSEDGRSFLEHGTWQPLRVVPEEIKVRGFDEPVALEVSYTPRGPVLVQDASSSNADDAAGQAALSFAWVHHDVAFDPGAADAINGAKDWQSFRNAVRRWSAAAQNFVYADASGCVGYQMAGPVMALLDGSGGSSPQSRDGSERRLVPFEDLPSEFCPIDGIVVTANDGLNVVAGSAVSGLWEAPLRATRIRQVLESTPRVAVQDCVRLQLDTRSLLASELVPLLLEAVPAEDDRVTPLRAWGYDMARDSAAAALFAEWTRSLVELVYDQCGQRLLRRLLVETKAWMTQWGMEGLRRWLRETSADVVADTILTALDRAWAVLERRLGPEPATWTWGQLHRVRYRNRLAVTAPLSALLDRGPVAAAGFDDTVCRGDSNHRSQGAPSYRMVVDTARWSRSVVSLPLGNSGNPGSENYGDQLDAWTSGRYHPMLFPAAVDAAPPRRLLLRPLEGETGA